MRISPNSVFCIIATFLSIIIYSCNDKDKGEITFAGDSCCVVTVTEGNCITGADSIKRRQVTFIPNCPGTSPVNYLYNIQNGITTNSTSGSGIPPSITVLYENAPVSPPTLTIKRPNNVICSINIPYTFNPCAAIPCTPCDTVVNITVQTPTDCNQVIDGNYPVIINASTLGICPPSQYIWNFGDGTPEITTTIPQVHHNYNCPHPDTTYKVTLKLSGCEGNPNYVSPTKTVPISFASCICPHINDIIVNDSFCTVNVSAVISGSCAHLITNYTWDFGDGTTVTVNSPNTNVSHIYTHNGDYEIKVTLVGVKTGCSFSKQIQIRCVEEAGDDCFPWPISNWYCWLLSALSLISLLIFILMVKFYLCSGKIVFRTAAIITFVLVLLFGILLGTLCNC